MRESPPAPGIAGYNGTVWGVLMAVDDSKKMQRVDARGHNGEYFTDIERVQTYGFTSVPVKPDENGAKAAEVAIGFRGGIRSHPYILATDDRRFRMKNLKEGESAHHDHRGQYSKIAQDRHERVAKTHTFTAGDKPEQGAHEMNDQLKGQGARLDQLERHLHGLFDATSWMRDLLQKSVAPNLAVLAPILSQTPDGLDNMEQAILGKAPAYLQKQMQQALGKFMSSPIAAVASVMGGQDDVIAALTAKIAGLIDANPVVKAVDGLVDLVDEFAALRSSGSPGVVAEMEPVTQGLIDAATGGNPIVGQVASLRSQLADPVAGAGPGLGFPGAQQRIPQRLSRSMRLAP